VVTLLSKHSINDESFNATSLLKQYLKPRSFDVLVLLIKCFSQLTPLNQAVGLELSSEIINNLMQFAPLSREDEQFMTNLLFSAMHKVADFKDELSILQSGDSSFSQVKLHFL